MTETTPETQVETAAVQTPESPLELTLRPVVPTDGPALALLLADEQCAAALNPSGEDVSDVVRLLLESMCAADATSAWLLQLPEAGRQVVGLVELFDYGYGRYGAAYAVLETFRGRGLAQQALHQLTGHVLARPGAQTLELFIDVDNAASTAVARRCGFFEVEIQSRLLTPGAEPLWVRRFVRYAAR